MDSARRAKDGRQELPCIWVLSGVLSYRLCDRDYECDGCELYHALSGEGKASGCATERTAGAPAEAVSASSPTGRASSHLSYLLAGCRLYLDRPYRPPHFWLVESEGDLITVGLDGTLLRMLHPIRRVVSPGPGLRLERDQPCGWIAREHKAIPFKMPIAGEVVETNASYGDATDPCGLREGEDWLFRVSPSESLDVVPGLVRAEETLSWAADRLRAVRRAIVASVSLPAEASVGPVLADGGAPQPSLERVIGRSSFEELIARIAFD